MEKQNRTRNIQVVFRVTPQEKEFIQEKMRLCHMTNFQKYARQMATKGYIVDVDFTVLKEMAAEMQKIDIAAKQILRFVDTLGAPYAADAAWLRQKQAECWEMLRQLFKEAMKLSKS
jgi:hypothetical protein